MIMKSFVVALVLGTNVTPVQKVVQMLQGMLQKGKQAKHEEEVQYASYTQWCGDIQKEKGRAITEGQQREELLQADIQKFTSDAVVATEKVAELDASVASLEGDKAAATKVRKVEQTDYRTTHKDYTESVDALGRAVIVLQQQNFDRTQAKSFLSQVSSLDLIAPEQKKVIDKFLEQDPEFSDRDAPEALGYEFQSQGVVDMLVKLKQKFEEERSTLEKEEANARHSYQMLVQDLAAQVEGNKRLRSNNVATASKKRQATADAKGDLADTQATLKDDTNYLNDVSSTCKIKEEDFTNRQELRTQELQAIEKAVEILSSGAVAGAAEKHLPALRQISAAASFLQLRSSRHQIRHDTNRLVARYLAKQAEKLHSRVLSTLALKASEDPFDKVRKMINDLIVRLMQEASEEADHKGWCDTQIKTNQLTRDEKTKAVETLRAEIDQLTASIAQHVDQIAELRVQVSDLLSAKKTAIANRQTEKAANEATIKDAQDAQTAVEQALTVLKEFYASAGQATALVQQPAVFDAPYTGMAAESGGVVGMLEVIVSDFARLETETAAAESQGDKQHTSLLTDTKVDIAQKTKDIEHKEATKQNQEQSLMEKKTDLEGTQKELDAAMEYYDTLKPTCVDAGVSYEERVARRKEEVESLQEALRILNGEDLV
eukprot:GEMP01030336.1.p1 GENE.GEMP01030336.1~~GEMP01030336.1.p1  ORF type:complete len:660 (+),score=220.40 GEMP01030336.1:149-2128(+)